MLVGVLVVCLGGVFGTPFEAFSIDYLSVSNPMFFPLASGAVFLVLISVDYLTAWLNTS
jgi:hypothetical protein